MVFGIQPKCTLCKSVESFRWHKIKKDEVLCQKCDEESSHLNSVEEANKDKHISADTDKQENENVSNNKSVNTKEEEEMDGDKERDCCRIVDKKDLRRKTRKGKQGGKGNIPKGKGRRYILKKSTTKAPVAVSTPITSEFLFYQGNYYQVGDIVSVIDIDGGTYYGQIRGLLQDQYCEKSAVLTWLLPTKNSPPPEEIFDPSTYIIGPEEDIPRKLEYLAFECHAPSDYFKDKSSPYSTISYKPQSCFVWSKFGPVIKPIECANELMGK